VAYIIPDEQLLTKAESPKALTYAQLAALKQRAMAGDSSAAIALTQMPGGEQRLAKSLVDVFGSEITKAEKPRKRKRTKSKKLVEKTADALTEHEKWVRSQLASDNPADREWARGQLGV
jgi:hypothetical protein